MTHISVRRAEKDNGVGACKPRIEVSYVAAVDDPPILGGNPKLEISELLGRQGVFGHGLLSRDAISPVKPPTPVEMHDRQARQNAQSTCDRGLPSADTADHGNASHANDSCPITARGSRFQSPTVPHGRTVMPVPELREFEEGSCRSRSVVTGRIDRPGRAHRQADAAPNCQIGVLAKMMPDRALCACGARGARAITGDHGC